MSENQSDPNANLPESCSTSNMIAYKRWWRARRKASGVCTTCGGERDSAKHVRCSRCRDAEYTAYHSLPEETKATKLGKMNEQVRIKRAGWEAEGLCNWCGAVRDIPNRKRCVKCQGKARKANNRRASKLRNQGLCPHCGEKPETSRRLCNKCRLIAKEEYRKFIERKKQLPPESTPEFLWCVDCLLDKPTSEFHRNFKNRSGFSGRCRGCKARWYAERSELIQEHRRKARIANPEKFRAQQRQSYRRKMEAFSRGERLELRARELAYYRTYRDIFRDVIRVRGREHTRRWRLRHPDWARAIDHACRYRRQQRIKENGGNFTGTEWAELKKAQDYTCLACGKREPEISLTPDHVVPISKKGSNDISNIQGLCLPCNLRKHTKETDYRPGPIPM